MTKENQLRILEVILEHSGINNHFDLFFDSYIRPLNISEKDFNDYTNELIEKNYLNDQYWTLEPSIHKLHENLKKEILEEEKLRIRELKLVKWKVRTYWIYVLIAISGAVCGVISLTNPGFDKSQYIKKTDLDKILKEYIKQDKHEDDLMGLHDLIYTDSTLINKEK